jgi:hypothetical protein
MNVREYRRGNEKRDNPEKLATGPRKTKQETQHNMCLIPLYANKHK